MHFVQNVFFLDKMAVNYWVANNSQQFKTIGQAMQVGFGYAIMANKSNNALMSIVNAALSAMEKDGSYVEIYRNYFGETRRPASR